MTPRRGMGSTAKTLARGALLTTLLLPALARADANPAPATVETAPQLGAAQRLEIDDCGAKPALPIERIRVLAGEHYDRGDVLYVQGDYVGAVREFVAS